MMKSVSTGPFVNQHCYANQEHQDADSVDAVHGSQEGITCFTFLFSESEVG
jgi:hypothetical protein